MPRSNWKGVISFGLVSIPIILTNAIDPSSNVSFKQINKKTGAPIKYKRIDSETGKEVAWENIGKGYLYEKDRIIPVEEGELEGIAGENARTIAIQEFVDQDHLNFINIDNTYYITPDKKGDKGYVILREALKSSKKVGIAKVIISTKEYLAAVSIYDEALVLYLLHYDDQIRSLSELEVPSDDIKKYKVTKTEIEVAKKLIATMTHKWRPEKYVDEYKQAVEKWVSNKIHHLPVKKMQARSQAKKGNVINFVDLLKQSVKESAKSKKSKSEMKFVPRKSAHARKRISTHH